MTIQVGDRVKVIGLGPDDAYMKHGHADLVLGRTGTVISAFFVAEPKQQEDGSYGVGIQWDTPLHHDGQDWPVSIFAFVRLTKLED